MNLNDTFKKIYSLGSDCTVAQQLSFADKKIIRGPFDWLVTPELKFISNEFETKCQDLFKQENLILFNTPYSEHGYLTVEDTYAGYLSLHDIKENENFVSQAAIMKIKFDQRMESLYHDFLSQTPIVLIRRLTETDDLLKLDEVLKRCFKHNHYLLIGVKSTEEDRFELEYVNDEIIIAHIQSNLKVAKCNAQTDWIGNTEVWQRLISHIKLDSEHKPVALNFNIIKSNICGRKIVVWGLGVGFSYVKYLFKKEGINDYLLYDSNGAEQCNLMSNISLMPFENISPEKYYVIISTLHFKKEIREALVDKGYTTEKDYMFMFNGMNNFLRYPSLPTSPAAAPPPTAARPLPRGAVSDSV